MKLKYRFNLSLIYQVLTVFITASKASFFQPCNTGDYNTKINYFKEPTCNKIKNLLKIDICSFKKKCSRQQRSIQFLNYFWYNFNY